MYILFDKPGLSQWFAGKRKEVGSRVATDDIYLIPWYGGDFFVWFFFKYAELFVVTCFF